MIKEFLISHHRNIGDIINFRGGCYPSIHLVYELISENDERTRNLLSITLYKSTATLPHYLNLIKLLNGEELVVDATFKQFLNLEEVATKLKQLLFDH